MLDTAMKHLCMLSSIYQNIYIFYREKKSSYIRIYLGLALNHSLGSAFEYFGASSKPSDS